MGRFERYTPCERLTQCIWAEVEGATVAFDLGAAASFDATTSTSGRGVSGGEGTFAVAGAYLSFQ